jgi:hypothetical protein
MKRLPYDLKVALIAALAVGSAGFVSVPAHAALVTYTGADNAVTSLAQMTNSVAAETAFNAAVPGASVITFETATPTGVSISGGTITNTTGACAALCGFNTTAGGQYFYELSNAGTATFTFTHAIDAFGTYITGLQTNLVPQETLTFSDGSTQTIDTPTAINGGGAFIGFTDFGKSILSVSYNATQDIVALDDVRYASATTAVPEPATLTLFGVGLLGLGMISRRKAA